jgi:NADH-quinone oxidoreductase subunit G
MDSISLDLDQVEAMHEKATAPEVAVTEALVPVTGEADSLWRIGDVPLYAGDALVRRSPALQQTNHAAPSVVHLNAATSERLSLGEAETVRVSQDSATVELPWVIDSRIPPNAVWLPVANCAVNRLGASYGPISVEAVE